MSALIRAQHRFLGRRTLILTGERAEESRARAHYATFEPDRTDTRTAAAGSDMSITGAPSTP